MFNHIHIGRRAFLQTSIFAAAGIQFANAEEKDYESVEGKAKSTIFIYLPGGISAQESFDPKTVAPLEYRGSMKAINTNVEGIQINDKFKRITLRSNVESEITDWLTFGLNTSYSTRDNSGIPTSLGNARVASPLVNNYIGEPNYDIYSFSESVH